MPLVPALIKAGLGSLDDEDRVGAGSLPLRGKEFSSILTPSMPARGKLSFRLRISTNHIMTFRCFSVSGYTDRIHW